MAILMLVTSISFALDIHYCKGEFKSLSLFGKAKSCHKQKAISACPHHANMHKQAAKDDCCDNKTTFVKAEIEKFFSSIRLADSLSIACDSVRTFYSKKSLKNQAIIFEHYKPPLIRQDISVLVQSFLL